MAWIAQPPKILMDGFPRVPKRIAIITALACASSALAGQPYSLHRLPKPAQGEQLDQPIQAAPDARVPVPQHRLGVQATPTSVRAASNLSLPTRLPSITTGLDDQAPRGELSPDTPSLGATESFAFGGPAIAPAEADQQRLIQSTATIADSRLREQARDRLGQAYTSLNRDAVHTAKFQATEALRLVVAMRDAASSTNEHTTRLHQALDAIRESADFNGRFGIVDRPALARMVQAHTTDVLKNRDLSDLSSLQATEMYLAAATTDLVAACGSSREASDALVLLGCVEKKMSTGLGPDSAAVALAMQRAAVAVDPENAWALRELGKTLDRQGLSQQAFDALQSSVALYPARTSYVLLLGVARKLGDVETARSCIDVIESPATIDDFPVHRLPPEQFSAMPPAAEATWNVVQRDQKQQGDAVMAAEASTSKAWYQFWR